LAKADAWTPSDKAMKARAECFITEILYGRMGAGGNERVRRSSRSVATRSKSHDKKPKLR